MKRFFHSAAAFTALLSLAGCEGWLGAKEKPALPGKRISVLALETALKPDPRISDLAVRLPRPMVNKDWPQAGGVASHAMHHLSAKGGLGRAWEVDIGDGSDDETQLLAQPVVANGRVFTMDAKAEVRAFDVTTGDRLWRRKLESKSDQGGILGAGIGYEGGRLFATTGFAQVFALDAKSGREIWRRRLSGPMRAPPTIAGGHVFVITVSNELVALNAKDGSVLWTHVGLPEIAGLIGGASPAVAGSVVVAPFSSGELVALRIENGRQVWTESLTAVRRANTAATLAHIRGRPVIDRGRVIAISNSGRHVAIDLRTGNRIWERNIGGIHAPWVAGSFIYVMSSRGELVCLTRRSGAIRWVRTMQLFEDEKDREDPIVWAGPVVAGDRVIVAGSNREVWSVSPYTGKLLGRVKVSGPVLVPPLVADDTVYVLTENAKLIALR